MREAGAGARETELCSLRFGKTLEGLGIQTCGLCAEGGREEEMDVTCCLRTAAVWIVSGLTAPLVIISLSFKNL